MKHKWKVSTILPLVHFGSSFFYERLILIFALDQNIVASRPITQFISTRAERILAYAISKILAFIMIWFLWNLIFFVIRNFKASKVVRTYTIIFLIGFLMLAFLWPTCFIVSADNYITYSYAIRLLPEYWHNAYSGYIYCGMLMVFPHPAAISFLQWLFFVFSLGYASYRIAKSPILAGRGKWLPLLFVLIPGSYALFTDGYRTEQYAIAAMIYLTLVAMDVIDRQKRTPLEIAGILFFSAFMSVWRTEGVIIGVMFTAILLFFGYRLSLKKTLCYMLGFAAAFLLVYFPHKIGDIKYYGKDYSIVNSFNTLQNILNAPDADLDYLEAVDDLLLIEKITPLDAIQLYGLDGYRRYNVICGRKDINQSMAGKEDTDAFLKAYHNLQLHNLKICFKTQFSMITTIWGISKNSYEADPVIEDIGQYPKWTYEAWDIGKQDYLLAPLIMPWAKTYFRQVVMMKILTVFDFFGQIRSTLKLDLIVYLLLPLSEASIALRELILLIRKKDGMPGLGGLAFSLLVLLVALILVIPAGLRVYFHAYYFMSLLLVGFYAITVKNMHFSF